MLHLSRSLVPALLLGLSGCGLEGPLFTATEVSSGGAGGTTAGGAGSTGEAGAQEQGHQSAPSIEGGASGADGGSASAGGAASSMPSTAGAATSGSTGGNGGSPPVPSGGFPSGGDGPSAGSGGGVTTHALHVEGVCKDKVVSAPALLGNFENGVSGWSSYIDSNFGPPWSSAPGAAHTGRAATFAGGQANESGLFHDMPCSDVTAFSGISFWAKGRGNDHVRFVAVIPATNPITEGGDCDEATMVCWDHPAKSLVLSNQWQQYSVAWQDLAQDGWGTPASFGGVLSSVQWVNDGAVESFEFSLDEVTLYAGVVP